MQQEVRGIQAHRARQGVSPRSARPMTPRVAARVAVQQSQAGQEDPAEAVVVQTAALRVEVEARVVATEQEIMEERATEVAHREAEVVPVVRAVLQAERVIEE